LAQRSEKLSASAPTLAVVESHFARQAVKQELEDQLQELNRIADHLERVSSANLAPLKQYKEAFAQNLVHLDNMVAQRIDAESTAGNALTRLGMLSSRIQALAAPDVRSLGESSSPDGDPDEVRTWAAAASAEVVALLSTATADNAVRLDRLRADFLDLQRQGQAKLNRAPSSYRKSPDAIEALLEQFGAGAANVFDARTAQLEAAAGVRRALIDNRQVSADFVGTSQELIKQVENTVGGTKSVLFEFEWQEFHHIFGTYAIMPLWWHGYCPLYRPIGDQTDSHPQRKHAQASFRRGHHFADFRVGRNFRNGPSDRIFRLLDREARTSASRSHGIKPCRSAARLPARGYRPSRDAALPRNDRIAS